MPARIVPLPDRQKGQGAWRFIHTRAVRRLKKPNFESGFLSLLWAFPKIRLVSGNTLI
jgi:hypothetical protein